MHISLHEFLNQVDFCEAIVCFGLDDIKDGDDVLMIEPSKELDLAQCAKTEHRMVKLPCKKIVSASSNATRCPRHLRA
jgi:hypothetical protein